MKLDRGKLFVGGIGKETTSEQLKEYFEKHGEVLNAAIVKDKCIGRSRGFGFVSFSDASVVDLVLNMKHVVGNRTVDVKQALMRDGHNPTAGRGNTNGNVGQSQGRRVSYFRTKKIFVGGLPATLTENEFRKYFGGFGVVNDVVIIYDRETRRPRGFGFITFDNEDSVDRVLCKTFHELNGKLVEVKHAYPQPKYLSSGGGSSDVHNGVSDFVVPPSSDVNKFSGQNMSNKPLLMQNTFRPFHPSYNYGAPYYNFYGFGGNGVGNYVFRAPMVAYQPPYTHVGYNTSSYGADPVAASRFLNVVGYGNEGHGYGSYMPDQ